jgi:hypothetical protein
MPRDARTGSILTEGRSLRDVAREVTRAIEADESTRDVLESGFTAWDDGLSDWPKHYRWIACYAVRGDSEGYYVHVDALVVPPTHSPLGTPWERRMLLLGKTFGGQEAAFRVAALVATLLDA